MKKQYLLLLLPLILSACNEEKPHSHVDANFDHVCDDPNCLEKLSDHVNLNNDHLCDTCNAKLSECEDTDNNGYCDICNLKLSNNEHKDDDKNDSEDLQEYTTTVLFSGSKYATSFPDGTNFDIQEKFDQLLEYLDDQLEYYDLVNEISCVKCASRRVESETYFQLSTGSSEGHLSWNSKVKIYKVEVEAMNYCKYNSYGGVWNVDNLAHLQIGSKDFSLVMEEGVKPTLKTYSEEFETGINDLYIGSTNGRVLIKQMKITWRG